MPTTTAVSPYATPERSSQRAVVVSDDFRTQTRLVYCQEKSAVKPIRVRPLSGSPEDLLLGRLPVFAVTCVR